MTLHRFTKEEFDALPVVNGRRQCPTGDYSAIKTFPERCSFAGDGASARSAFQAHRRAMAWSCLAMPWN